MHAPRGFTLIEVMLVVLIIGILSSFALPYYQKMTARSYRSEAQVVLSKMRVYFVNLYDNQAKFDTAGVTTGGVSPWNPNVPPGQNAAWDASTSAWKELPFPPEGAIKMRYQYSVLSASKLQLSTCGSFPGLGPNTLDCGGGMLGNYLYAEFVYPNGGFEVASEFPSF